MFNLFDDVALLAKRGVAFVTGRGATMTAVATATRFVGATEATFAPILGLTLGLPITAAMSTMVHHHRESTIMNNFREEIASQFHIHEMDVTHDHLRALAFGDKSLGIEPQPFFEEIIKKNDKNRWIDIGGNIVAAMLTIGFVTTIAAAGVIGSSLALAVAAGGMMFAMDQVFTNIGNSLFGDKGRSAYEKIETLARKQGHQQSISPEEAMGVIATVNPDIRRELENRYRGASYELLPFRTRQALLQEFDQQFDITGMTQKINEGTVKLNELAFVAGGERSGVPEDPQHIDPDEPFILEERSPTIRQRIPTARQNFVDHTKEQQLANDVLSGKSNFVSAEHTQQAAEEALDYAGAPPTTQPEQPETTHAARFADKQAHQSVSSYVERYAPEKNAANNIVPLKRRSVDADGNTLSKAEQVRQAEREAMLAGSEVTVH